MISLLNKKMDTSANNLISQSFDELSSYFKNWSRILFNQTAAVKSNLKDFFNSNTQASIISEFAVVFVVGMLYGIFLIDFITSSGIFGVVDKLEQPLNVLSSFIYFVYYSRMAHIDQLGDSNI